MGEVSSLFLRLRGCWTLGPPSFLGLAASRQDGPDAGEVGRAPLISGDRLLYRSPKFFTTLIPLRDGFAVCEKIRS